MRLADLLLPLSLQANKQAVQADTRDDERKSPLESLLLNEWKGLMNRAETHTHRSNFSLSSHSVCNNCFSVAAMGALLQLTCSFFDSASFASFWLSDPAVHCGDDDDDERVWFVQQPGGNDGDDAHQARHTGQHPTIACLSRHPLLSSCLSCRVRVLHGMQMICRRGSRSINHRL